MQKQIASASRVENRQENPCGHEISRRSHPFSLHVRWRQSWGFRESAQKEHMPDLIRTTLKHEASAPGPDPERGSRYWLAAEIMSSTWFVIEACTERAGRNEIQRWVTTSIREAARLQHSQEPFVWSNIFVCLRAPLSIRSATVFEKVTEAYQAGAGGSYLYRLGNGMSFITDEKHAQGVPPAPDALELVYAHRG
jgi:hypothetical protein